MSLKHSFVVYLRLKITLHKSKWIKLLHSQKETWEQLQRTDLPEYSKTQQNVQVRHVCCFFPQLKSGLDGSVITERWRRKTKVLRREPEEVSFKTESGIILSLSKQMTCTLLSRLYSAFMCSKIDISHLFMSDTFECVISNMRSLYLFKKKRNAKVQQQPTPL